MIVQNAMSQNGMMNRHQPMRSRKAIHHLINQAVKKNRTGQLPSINGEKPKEPRKYKLLQMKTRRGKHGAASLKNLNVTFIERENRYFNTYIYKAQFSQFSLQYLHHLEIDLKGPKTLILA